MRTQHLPADQGGAGFIYFFGQILILVASKKEAILQIFPLLRPSGAHSAIQAIYP